MATEYTLKPAGLYTDLNPVSAVPPGAMREALNVVIRRDGIVEPRPGFKKTLLVDSLSAPDTADVTRAIPWKTSVLTYDATGLATFHLTEFGGTAQNDPYQLTGAVGTDFVARAVEARENLYVCATDGVRKYIDVTDDVPETAGIYSDGLVTALATLGTSGFLPTGNEVAYRTTLVRRDGNSVVVTSEPSPRSVLNNGLATSAYVQLTTDLPPNTAVAGDELHYYRSVTVAADPSDELFLAKVYVITSTDVTNGYVATSDECPESGLGAALYTNASQEGILQANTPPPKLADMTLFRGSLFGANVQARKSMTLTRNWSASNLAGVATGIGFRQISGTSAIGSPTITGVASTAGIEAGQILLTITGNGADFVSAGNLATVVSKTANTITFSANSLALRAPGSFMVSDSVEIPGDGIFAAYNPAILALAISKGSGFSYQVSVSGDPSTTYTAQLVTDLNMEQPTTGAATVVIREKRPGSSAVTGIDFALNATKPTEYQPALGAIGATYTADAAYVDDGIDTNALLYSKQDQPEAMPYPTNLIRVGSSSHAIERILATKDALWIFKRDGVFRLTGSGAPNWRVDPFDMTHCLIAVDSAVVMDDAIFAWTNRGVVRISDAGITQISALAIGSDLREAELYGMAQSNAGTPFGSPASSVFAGGWAIANVKDDEYIFAMLSSLSVGEGVSYTVQPYVYNTKTLAWTRWSMRHAITAGTVSGAGEIVFGGEDINGAGCLSVERSPLTTADGAVNADWNYDSVGNGVITLDYFAASDPEVYTMALSAAYQDWVPAVGDVLYFNGNPGTITAVASSTAFTIYITDAVTGDMNSANVREAIACEMEFVAKFDGKPGTEKPWQGGTVEWGSTNFVDRYATSFTSALIASAVSTTQRADEWPDNTTDVPFSARFWVPRNHSRASVLFPEITIAQADAPWQLYGITLSATGASKAVRR